jgi:hypothetical protein
MSVRFLEISEYEQWDNFVDQSEQGSIFSKSWWLTVTTAGDFKICICEGDGEIFAGMPLPYYSTGNIRMPMLTQSVGILFVDKKDIKIQKKLTNQKEHTNLIYEFIKIYVKTFNLNFHYNYNFWSPFFWLGFKQTTKYTYVIDYKDFQADHFFSSFSKGHKWLLNKVEKSNSLQIEELLDVDVFYQEAKKTYQRKGLKISYSLPQLYSINNELTKHNAGKMFKIIDSLGNTHAVAYYLFDHNEVYYWLGASDEQYRNGGAHTYLIWHAIKYFSNKTRRFNFGGSMMEEVDKNFRNFGATPMPYYAIYKQNIRQKLISVLKDSLSDGAKNKLKKLTVATAKKR